jgi:hypothetical protein
MEEFKTVKEVKENCDVMASQEDDREHYYGELTKRCGVDTDNFQKVTDLGDVVIYRNGNYYVINDCGTCTLYRKKKGKVGSHKFEIVFTDGKKYLESTIDIKTAVILVLAERIRVGLNHKIKWVHDHTTSEKYGKEILYHVYPIQVNTRRLNLQEQKNYGSN